MEGLDLGALPAWLQRQRWFGGKGAEIASVQVVDEAPIGDLQVATLEVRYAGTRRLERYLLPFRRDTDGLPEEKLDEDSCRAIFEIMRGCREVRTRVGVLRGERFDGPDSPLRTLPEKPAVRRLSAEQSNTSIVFGEAVILKLIRKLDQGRNPELEIGALLARRKFRSTPTLLGALSLEGEIEATVGVAHRFVRVESDGWTYVVEALMAGPSRLTTLLPEVRDLGARVGELHVALAAGDDPAFAPEPIRREDLQRWSRTVQAELDATALLAAEALPQLAARTGALRARVERLAEAAPSGVRLRQHGDLHLGQVLRSDGQWLIFDFEGEPARPLAERREKHAPYKDVAGMLRSFAYAAATAEKRGVRVDVRGPVESAFLDGYRSCASGLLPTDERTAGTLLDALEMEKLLYELRYELGHRPDWVDIPARDLLREQP
jgi:trehalose synthase-fused probable maltokinase